MKSPVPIGSSRLQLFSSSMSTDLSKAKAATRKKKSLTFSPEEREGGGERHPKSLKPGKRIYWLAVVALFREQTNMAACWENKCPRTWLLRSKISLDAIKPPQGTKGGGEGARGPVPSLICCAAFLGLN